MALQGGKETLNTQIQLKATTPPRAATETNAAPAQTAERGLLTRTARRVPRLCGEFAACAGSEACAAKGVALATTRDLPDASTTTAMKTSTKAESLKSSSAVPPTNEEDRAVVVTNVTSEAVDTNEEAHVVHPTCGAAAGEVPGANMEASPCAVATTSTSRSSESETTSEGTSPKETAPRETSPDPGSKESPTTHRSRATTEAVLCTGEVAAATTITTAESAAMPNPYLTTRARLAAAVAAEVMVVAEVTTGVVEAVETTIGNASTDTPDRVPETT